MSKKERREGRDHQDAGHLDAFREARNKQKTEEEVKKEEEKKLAFLKEREKSMEKEDAKDKLEGLKSSLDRGVVSFQEAEETLKSAEVKSFSASPELRAIIEEIFEQIDELQNLEKYNQYLPKELQVSRKEYEYAINNPHERPGTRQKIENALKHLAQHTTDTSGGMNIFFDVFTFLDKTLVQVQETHIDMKRGLEQADKELQKAA